MGARYTGAQRWTVKRAHGKWCDRCSTSTEYTIEVLYVTFDGITSERATTRCEKCDDEEQPT